MSKDVELNEVNGHKNGSGNDDGERRYSEGGEYVTVFTSGKEGAGHYNGSHAFGMDHEGDDTEYILDDQDEDLGLLDWDQYARIRRKRCCGLECPDLATLAPLWWYKLPKTRRRQFSVILPSLAFVLLLAIIVSFTFSSKKEGGAAGSGVDSLCDWDSYVLPTHFKPLHYDVDIQVEWKDPYKVDGKVEVYFAPENEYIDKGTERMETAVEDSNKLTRCLVLHAGANLDVGAIGFVMTDGGKMGEKRRRYNEEKEQLVIEFEKPISPSQLHHVTLTYSYPLVESMRGFYRSNYKDSKNVTHMLASTQMEAADARRAFPCFDQPNMKADFDFTIRVLRPKASATRDPDDFQVLFNTPLREGGYSRRYDGDVSVDEYVFEPTPTMSTYLVAFVMGDLVQLTDYVDNGRVTVSVWGTPEHADDLSDALNSCVKILPAYEKLFGIPFPLKKLDLVAIPSFEAGAMENWGLITYRESSLLVNKDDASDFDILWATTTVAHELAHMWFGNLVTMDWWNDLFLNEGFAEYIQYIGVSVAKPEYGADELFPVLTLQNALVADSYDSSHPLHVPYEETLSSIEIDGLFDGITYDKGASVIRMLRSYMSGGKSMSSDHLLDRDPFIRGVSTYLNEYKYHNANSSQFWHALDKNANIDDFNVLKSIKSWISRPNYPLVRVSWKEKPDGNNYGTLGLSQVPFQKTGVQSCSSADPNSVWWVPFAYNTKDKSGVVGVLDECTSNGNSEVALQSQDDFVLVNAGQSGFYRVNYPQDMWKRLEDNIATGKISSVDTSMLLDDAYALVEARELSVSTLLDLAYAGSKRKYANIVSGGSTSDYQAWFDIGYVFNAIEAKMESSSCHDTYKSFVEAAVTKAIEDYNIVESLTRTNAESIEGDFQYRLLVGSLFSLGVRYGSSGVEQLAKSSFSNAANVDANIRFSVYKARARSGLEGYGEVLEKYNTAIDADEKEKLLLALGSVQSADLITRSLDLAMTPVVASMDVRSFVARIAGSSQLGREMSWTYLQNNFDALYEKVNGGTDVSSSRLAKLVSRVCSGFSSDERLAQVKTFYEKYKKWIPVKTFHKIEENIRTNKMWLERNEKEVCTWEKENRP